MMFVASAQRPRLAMFRRVASKAAVVPAVATARSCGSVVPKGTADMTAPESSEKVKEFAAFYTQLTLKEVTALQREIFKQLGHSDDFYEQALLRGMGGGGGGGVAVAAAPAAAPAAAAEEKAPEPEKKKPAKTAFDVNLESYPDGSKIKLIKDLRGVTNDSIKEAKDLIEKKGVVAKNLSQSDADKLVELFKANGASATVQ